MKTKLILAAAAAMQVLTAQTCHATEDYVAHEWGTFTSVQGADGIPLMWNPLVTSELPGFVYNPNRIGTNASGTPVLADKGLSLALQRMETPVIYFYSPEARMVDVAVDFPQGSVTEWYPNAARASSGARTSMPVGQRSIEWKQVQILPLKQNESLQAGLPLDRSGSHYFAARGTDSDLLRLSKTAAGAGTEIEKFLFYRGLGNFHTPLTVTQSSDGLSVTLQNTSSEELRHLFIYTLHQGKGALIQINRLERGASKSIELGSTGMTTGLETLRREVAGELRKALVQEGLYPKEAEAMLKTWDDSWFAEQGTRVFYTLPRAATDRILPLKLTPEPRETVRVMVGRAELITPEMEWEWLKQVVRFTDGDTQSRARAVQDARALGLGRFLPPTVKRLSSRITSPEFQNTSWQLLQAVSAPAPDSLRLSAK